MLRRAAIDSINGFATGTATEDIHTSLRLHAKGWRSLFLSEQLAHGIAAEDLGEYHKQRVRWGAGSLGLLFRSPDSPLRARGLTFAQRLCYFNSTISFLNGLQRLAYIILPAFILISLPFQHQPPAVSLGSYALIALPFVIISYVVTYIFSRRTFHPLYTEQFNIINIYCNILAIKGIFNVQKKFKVSLKRRGSKNESSAYRVLLLMWAVTFIAAAAAPVHWYFGMQRSTAELLRSAVAVSMLWNFINLYFISSVIYFVNFHSERLSSEHALTASEVLRPGVPGEQALQLERVSLRGADVLSSRPLPAELRLAVNDSFLISAQTIRSHRLKNGKYRTVLKFHNNSLADETKLTLFMFNRLVPKLFKDEYVIDIYNA